MLAPAIGETNNNAKIHRRFIRPELVPVQYGGLSRAGDLENGPPKPASEFTIKGGEKVFLEIDGIEVRAPNFRLSFVLFFLHRELKTTALSQILLSSLQFRIPSSNLRA